MTISLTKDEANALFCCLYVGSEGLDEDEDKTFLANIHNIEKKMKEAIVRDRLKKMKEAIVRDRLKKGRL